MKATLLSRLIITQSMSHADELSNLMVSNFDPGLPLDWMFLDKALELGVQ